MNIYRRRARENFTYREEKKEDEKGRKDKDEGEEVEEVVED